MSDARPGTGATATSAAAPSRTPALDAEPEASVGELIKGVAADLSTLMRQELELAKIEMKEEAKNAGKAAGMLGVAGFAGYLTILFLSVAAMFGLDQLMPLGWAALIVALVWGIVGAILFVTGKKKLAAVNPKPEATIETVKEDVQWAKTRNA